MNTNHAKRIVVGAVLVAAATSGGVAIAATTGSDSTHAPATPDKCIRLNGGDYNACNVGNSGRGDLPYRPVTRTQ
jgi:hypothetical protein